MSLLIQGSGASINNDATKESSEVEEIDHLLFSLFATQESEVKYGLEIGSETLYSSLGA